MSTPGFFVTANYLPKMDDRRRARIEAAITAAGARFAVVAPAIEVEGQMMSVITTDVDWNCDEGDTDTQMEIFVADGERANRLAAELRACGMTASVRVAS